MYIVYEFIEKKTNKVIYVGSTARPCERIKEHKLALEGKKPQANIHRYMNENNLKFYRDVIIAWVDYGDTILEGRLKEETLFYAHRDTVLNTRPGEDRKDGYNPRSKLIRCLEDNNTFTSTVEASKFYGVSRQKISKHLNGIRDYVSLDNGTKIHFECIKVLNV